MKRLLIIMLFLFVIMALISVNKSFIDLQLNGLMVLIQNQPMTIVAIIIAYSFDTITLLLVSIVIIIYLWFSGDKIKVFLFGLTMAANTVMIALLKWLIHTSRPVNALVSESSNAFPSGHATSTVVFFGLLIYIFWFKINHKRMILSLYALAVLIIGFSRIYLNVHWLTDVLGGYLLGLSILTLSVIIYEYYNKNYVK